MADLRKSTETWLEMQRKKGVNDSAVSMSINLTSKENNKKTQMIQWAGELHSREDFNKKRDMLGQWTDCLFSH